MAFSPDLTLLASPNYPEVDLWDVAGGKEPRVLSEHRGAVGCVAFTADSKTLVAASSWNKGDFRYQGQVKLWDVATGREKATLKGDFGYIWALAISPDSKVLAAVQSRGDLGEDGVMEVVDVACGRKLVSQTWKAGSVPSLTFRADGTLFVTATTGNTIKLWEVTPHGQGKNAGAAR
jgi:WD40 repeat protein